MTKLLYVPSGDYITFSTVKGVHIRTVIYEDSDYIHETMENIIKNLCDGVSGATGLNRNIFLEDGAKYTLSEFEVIYD